MDKRTVRSALISTDLAFREQVQAAAAEPERAIDLAVEISAPFVQIGDEQMKQLREVNPVLIFLDLEDEPSVGIRLAQFLVDANPDRRFIAAGPTLEPDQLMAAMRAGISEYLPKPTTTEAMSAAIERMERKILGTAKAGTRQPGRLLAFFSPKGGSGSTTVATNVAIQLHRLTGKRTLLVDLDLELGEIALFLGMQPRFNFVDLIRNFHRMDSELLASFIETHDSGVHLLSAPYHPEKVEVVTGEQIRKILNFLKQHYEFVVVDTSKSFSPATLAAFEQSESIFLVTNVDLPSLRNIKRCFPLIQRIVGNAPERVRLIVNRYHPQNVISLKDVKDTLELDVFWTLSNDYEPVIRSINSGKPIILNGNSIYTRDLKALSAEIAGLKGTAEPESGALSRILGRFSGKKR